MCPPRRPRCYGAAARAVNLSHALHQARIRIKRWRYALECPAEAIPDGPWRPVEPLRDLQGALGDVHDRALLAQVFARHAFDPMSQGDRAPLHALIGALVGERERAPRKFQGLAAAEIGAAGNGGASDPAAEAPSGTRPAAAEPRVTSASAHSFLASVVACRYSRCRVASRAAHRALPREDD